MSAVTKPCGKEIAVPVPRRPVVRAGSRDVAGAASASASASGARSGRQAASRAAVELAAARLRSLTLATLAERLAASAAGGLLFFGPLLMILFRRKYPRWWFEWNLELQRFGNRVTAYVALMDDRYPSTDDHQSVLLHYDYPDVERDLNRWLPLVKWLLAIPHYGVLFFLDIAAVVVVIVTWFTILFTGRYPRGMFGFVEGVIRWHNRVIAYAFTLVTDRYPPFRLDP